jgi:hypothetical protein
MYGIPSIVEEYDGEVNMVVYRGWKKNRAARRSKKVLIAAAVAAILLIAAKAGAQNTTEPPKEQLQQISPASPLVMAMWLSKPEPVQRPVQAVEVPVGMPPINSASNPSKPRERACMEQNRRGEWVQVPMRHCANLHTKKQ